MPLSEESHDIGLHVRLITSTIVLLSAYTRWLNETLAGEPLDLVDVESHVCAIQDCAKTIELRASAAMTAAREAKEKEAV